MAVWNIPTYHSVWSASSCNWFQSSCQSESMMSSPRPGPGGVGRLSSLPILEGFIHKTKRKSLFSRGKLNSVAASLQLTLLGLLRSAQLSCADTVAKWKSEHWKKMLCLTSQLKYFFWPVRKDSSFFTSSRKSDYCSAITAQNSHYPNHSFFQVLQGPGAFEQMANE